MSSGCSLVEDIQSPKTLAQPFLAPLGTCWGEASRMTEMDGRGGGMGEETGGQTGTEVSEAVEAWAEEW